MRVGFLHPARGGSIAAGAAKPEDGGGDFVGTAEAADGLVGDGFGKLSSPLAVMSVTIGVSMVPGQMARGDFAPKLVTLTDDILFGDIWRRPELPPRDAAWSRHRRDHQRKHRTAARPSARGDHLPRLHAA